MPRRKRLGEGVGQAMDRRRFMSLLAAAGAGVTLASTTGCEAPPDDGGPDGNLPAVKKNSIATETVLNSRRSHHSGFAGALSDQVLANVLWATSRAPLTASSRTIYAGLPSNVYRYDPAHHELILHLAGNHLSLSNLGFEVGIISDVTEDAGVATQFGLLAATAFLKGTSNQPGFCPRSQASDNATGTWNAGTFTFASSFGLMGTVSGITTELVALCSDASLPDPSTGGSMVLEDAMENLDYASQFAAQEPGIGELSQIAWASYGNAPHTTNNGRAALTAPSSFGDYYLSGRVYIVRSAGIERYLIRLPGGGATTRDHRIERVVASDLRPSLRSALARVPQSAPVYFVYCATTTGSYQRLESGFAGAGALLQATSLGLRGYLTTGFSGSERTAIIDALGIPSGDLPLLIVSIGRPAT